jgi:hypothetical protein
MKKAEEPNSTDHRRLGRVLRPRNLKSEVKMWLKPSIIQAERNIADYNAEKNINRHALMMPSLWRPPLRWIPPRSWIPSLWWRPPLRRIPPRSWIPFLWWRPPLRWIPPRSWIPSLWWRPPLRWIPPRSWIPSLWWRPPLRWISQTIKVQAGGKSNQRFLKKNTRI